MRRQGQARATRGRRRILGACWLGLLAATMAQARAEPAPAGERVLLWPRDPRTDVQPGERALARAGRAVVPFGGLGARLRERGELAEARAGQVLDEVAQGLERARQAYLEQRFDDMIAALDDIEARSLAVLAEPQHVGVLWEVSFQRGLAHRARAARGGEAGDAAQAVARFRLALALDPERRPLRELYGPDVSAAFAEAVSADAAAPERPVRVEVTPADASVVVDGVPVVAPIVTSGGAAGRTRHLRPGLHVARASAPGYETGAVLVTVDENRLVRLALRERRDADPLARIDATWNAGVLAPGTASGQRAITAAAASVGAGLVVVVDAASVPGRVTAQALAVEGRGERVGARVDASPGAPVQADTMAGAVDAALARWEGRVTAPVGIAGPAARPPPWWQRWWVWAGVGGALAAGAAAAVLITRDDADRWQIYVPPP